jgi:hypothetical protein
MPEQPLFFLVSILDDALVGHWTFRAADELSVMRHLLRNPWNYERVFQGLDISLRRIEQVTPDELLRAIQQSYGPSRCPEVLYLIRVTADEVCAVDNAATCVET